MKKVQVAIVGGGPVGVALAVQLGMRDISCVLVETRTELGRIPKGQNLTHRTLESFYFMGLVDELRSVRLLPPGFAIGEITNRFLNLLSALMMSSVRPSATKSCFVSRPR